MFADLTVVANHDEVINLRAGADASWPERAAVDGGTSPDLDIVLYLHPAELRHFHVPTLLNAIPEPVSPNHGVGVDDDPVADDGVVVENHVRVQRHVLAELAEPSDHNTGMQSTIRSEFRPLSRPPQTDPR